MSAVFMYIFSGIIIPIYNTPKITYYYQGYFFIRLTNTNYI